MHVLHVYSLANHTSWWHVCIGKTIIKSRINIIFVTNIIKIYMLQFWIGSNESLFMIIAHVVCNKYLNKLWCFFWRRLFGSETRVLIIIVFEFPHSQRTLTFLSQIWNDSCFCWFLPSRLKFTNQHYCVPHNTWDIITSNSSFDKIQNCIMHNVMLLLINMTPISLFNAFIHCKNDNNCWDWMLLLLL